MIDASRSMKCRARVPGIWSCFAHELDHPPANLRVPYESYHVEPGRLLAGRPFRRGFQATAERRAPSQPARRWYGDARHPLPIRPEAPISDAFLPWPIGFLIDLWHEVGEQQARAAFKRPKHLVAATEARCHTVPNVCPAPDGQGRHG